MVIDPGNNINVQNSAAGRARQSAPSKPEDAATSTKPSASTGDSVSLSSAGQAIAKIEAELVNSSEVNDAKVAELKSAINSGTYSADPQAIAQKMLDQDSLF